MGRWSGAAWILALSLTVGCKRDVDQAVGSAAGATTAAPAKVDGPATSPAPGSAPSGSLTAEGCVAEPDYLLPPTAFGDRDLIRAIFVQGSDVYLANMTDVLRLPLAGGAATKVAKTPGMTLSGRMTLWGDGTRLLTQSSGEPIFMELRPGQDQFTTFLDFTAEQRGGGRDAATRILQGIGKGTQAMRAGWADFDGQAFHWTESPAQRRQVGVGRVRSVPLIGGEPKTLYEAPGTADGLVRAGSHLVFIHTEPPDPVALAKYEADRKAKKYGPEPKGKSTLVSIPLAGGQAVPLLRMSQWMSRAVLVTDGETVFASGYLDEDLQKPGVYRVEASGGAVEALDPRVVTGEGVRYPGGVALVGSSFIAKGVLQTGVLVLAVPKGASTSVQVACFTNRFTMHAVGISGSTLLVSLLDGQTGLASVVRLPLP